jgi:hypothetical protein
VYLADLLLWSEFTGISRYRIASENAAKALGLTSLAKRLMGRHEYGGVRWNKQPLAENVAHVRLITDTLTQWLGDIHDPVGIT